MLNVEISTHKKKKTKIKIPKNEFEITGLINAKISIWNNQK
jgi:hypothetical protein